MSSATSPPPEGTPDGPPRALQVVLFGMPDAGKSSLLGALAQAALTQERALDGRLVGPDARLAELQRRVYDEQPRETTGEVVPYPVTYETARPGSTPAAVEAVLYDCDGRVANELLTRRRSLTPKAPAGSLTRAVLSADALLLVIDASAGSEQIDADFAEFVRFLRVFRSYRGTRGEVGGLPVFLVLSKCDLLARSGDSSADWQARIASRKAEVAERFAEFLADADAEDDSPEPFGSLEVRVGATAVRRPPLAGLPAQPREPFGVAEVFRDTLDAARRFRLRRRSAGRRLWLTLLGAGSLLAIMLATTFVLLSLREHTAPDPLAGRVENYRAREGLSAAGRLRGALVARRGELTEFRRDPGFKSLPIEQRQFVERRLKELEDYIALQDRLARERPPADALTLDDLDALEKRLTTEVAVPADYAEEWALTEAVQVRAKWLADIPALRDAVNRAIDWYSDLKRQGDRLADRLAVPAPPGADRPPLLTPSWAEDVSRLFTRADRPPFRETDVLPGAGSAPGQPLVTYAAALKFARVRDVREQWEQVRQRLERLRNLAVALGLTGETAPDKAPLRVPADFKVADATPRIEAYRRIPQAAEMSVVAQPDSVQPELRGAAQESYRRLIEAGRVEVLRQLREISPDDRETPQRWREVAARVTTTPTLRDWRELALAVGRLLTTNPEDPVVVLADFLNKSEFELNLRSLRVSIPDDLRDRLRPDGKFTIFHQSAGEPAPRKVTFRQEGEGEKETRALATAWNFAADGPPKLTVKPGDTFWAELPLKDAGGKGWTLTWLTSRARTYEFMRLNHAPQLKPAEAALGTGDPVPRVTLTASDPLPVEPELLPEVRLGGR